MSVRGQNVVILLGQAKANVLPISLQHGVTKSALEVCFERKMHHKTMFLPRDATQSAVLSWQVVCPSVCDVEVSWSHRLVFTIIL